MIKRFTQAADEVAAGIGLIRENAPDAAKAFGSLAVAATASRSLDSKTKELMALAISIVVGCEGCIAYHVHDAIQAGATRSELLETVGVGLFMGGGPGSIYAAHALEAIDQMLPVLQPALDIGPKGGSDAD